MSEPEEMDDYIFPVFCVCGWVGMSDDCKYMLCPDCGARAVREKEC
ncbi:MAG: hypothetical protein WC455_17660 [Dehalococcoidia bacterium]